MNQKLLALIALLFLTAGCASSSAVKTRNVEHGQPPVQSSTPEPAGEFHISAADAASALNEFARQSDTQVLFDYNVLRTRQTRAVAGTLPPSDALEALLKGSGLIATPVNEHTLAITPDRSGHAMR
ncbi:MAG: STN domain-containing protein [Proteobacteria bacterium]|nr:STN domain-containing protein [Pseudomonadota bacterium]